MKLPKSINLIGATNAQREAVQAKLIANGQTMYSDSTVTSYKGIRDQGDGEWFGHAPNDSCTSYHEFLNIPTIDFHF